MSRIHHDRLVSLMKVYFVTDRHLFELETVEEACRSMLEAGVRTIQLRDKEATAEDLLASALRLRSLCHDYGALFIINDDPATAARAGADGVHVGQGDAPAAAARGIIGPDAILGVSVRTPEEAAQAERSGADYVAANGVFSTPTKTDLDAPLGLEGIRRIRAATSLPVVAIGGIDSENAAEVLSAGADCLAGVRIRWDGDLMRMFAPGADRNAR
ncbi:MAG TPA: thiamine phosphate synthase [Candidatus Fermentibacter daniensis]|nr:thiamine phosphate synthase [Candidatus Fermentibacter daniensis]